MGLGERNRSVAGEGVILRRVLSTCRMPARTSVCLSRYAIRTCWNKRASPVAARPSHATFLPGHHMPLAANKGSFRRDEIFFSPRMPLVRTIG